MMNLILIFIVFTLLLTETVFTFKIFNAPGQQCPAVNMKLSAEISSSDLQQVNDGDIVQDARLAEWERRKKKELICKSMPRSQKWFKAKQQHVSPNQKRIYNEHWPTYGINLKYGTKVIPQELFPNITVSNFTPVVLDIGFGTGDSIVGMSQQNKDKIYLGCEIHRAGISVVLEKITTLGIENVKLIRADVTMLLETYLVDRCLDEVCIFFPDPWPNTERDGERRVVRKDIINLLSQRMRPGGLLRIATDVPDYAEHVRTVMSTATGWALKGLIEHPPLVDGPSYRPVTRYENKAIELSNRIWDFEFIYK